MRRPQRACSRQCPIIWPHRKQYLSRTTQILRSSLKIIRGSTWQAPGKFTLNRPDKIRAMRHGGFADVEAVFDGRSLSLFNKDANLYGQVDVPGTVDHLIDELRDKYHKPVPGADLLLSDVYDQLMPSVIDTKDLGSGVIGGIRNAIISPFEPSKSIGKFGSPRKKLHPLSLPIRHHVQARCRWATIQRPDRRLENRKRSRFGRVQLQGSNGCKKGRSERSHRYRRTAESLCNRRRKMTATKHLVVALLAGALGLLCLGLGERLSIPGVHGFISTADAQSRTSVNACECCRSSAALGAALRGRRDLLEFSHSTSAPMPDQAKQRYDWATIGRSQSAR